MTIACIPQPINTRHLAYRGQLDGRLHPVTAPYAIIINLVYGDDARTTPVQHRHSVSGSMLSVRATSQPSCLINYAHNVTPTTSSFCCCCSLPTGAPALKLLTGDFSVFRPIGATLIIAKFGTSEESKNPLRHTKVHVDRSI